MSHLVVGVDEAGRGPLAGPVVAAAVILDPARPVAGLADSKALDAAERERLSELLRARALGWCVAVASPLEIDAINILQATMLAMRRALLGLLGSTTAEGGRYGAVRVEVDGNRLPSLAGIDGIAEAVAIVKGDATQPAISAASILAKTARDRVMEQLDTRHPGYGFAIHKGYPTPAHLAALKAQGPSSVHRRSFGPVKSAAR
ncbi:MAG: ribonuclease HII [Steroidobacteraceae bacterium]